MTTFGDQVFQYGGVPVDSGGNRRVQMFQSGNIWFVDGDDGLSGNSGLRPNDALTSITQVLAATGFGRMATIYIKPRTTAASAQTYYRDTVTIPVTATGLSILGAGNTGSLPNVRGGVQYKCAVGSETSHLFTINAGSVWFDNLRLTGNSMTASNQQTIISAINSSSGNADGLTVTNCLFEADAQISSPGNGYGGCIFVCAGQVRIENNMFYACKTGITVHAYYGNPTRMLVRGNQFCGKTSARDADVIVSINSANCDGLVFDSNIFADGLPALSTGSFQRYIYMPYVTAGSGIFSNNYFATISVEQEFKEGGADGVIADNFPIVGSWCRGSSNTAPYGIITDA